MIISSTSPNHLPSKTSPIFLRYPTPSFLELISFQDLPQHDSAHISFNFLCDFTVHCFPLDFTILTTLTSDKFTANNTEYSYKQEISRVGVQIMFLWKI
jgi:hypothetical protein